MTSTPASHLYFLSLRIYFFERWPSRDQRHKLGCDINNLSSVGFSGGLRLSGLIAGLPAVVSDGFRVAKLSPESSARTALGDYTPGYTARIARLAQTAAVGLRRYSSVAGWLLLRIGCRRLR